MRRKYIVDSKFQWTIVGYSVVISLLTSLMHMTLSRLSAVKTLPPLMTGLVFGGFYIGIFLLALFFSNRLAGPLYRLRRHLGDAVRGKKLEKIFFRDKDFYSDLNETYNQYVDFLDNKKGFALAELVVVVGMVGILATMAITSSLGKKTKDDYQFKNEVSSLTEALNTARTAAFTKNQCAIVTVVNPQTVTVNTYAMPSPCNQMPLPQPDLQQVIQFSPATTVANFSVGDKVIFKPTGGLTTVQPVTININSSNGNHNTLTIYPAIGQVRRL